MSVYTIQDIILTTIQILVLIGVSSLAVKMSSKSKNNLILVFFIFALLSFTISDLYYLVYSFLRPDTRMPFAAYEIAELA